MTDSDKEPVPLIQGWPEFIVGLQVEAQQSQAGFARALGITPQAVRAWVDGRAKPSQTSQIRFKKVLGITDTDTLALNMGNYIGGAEPVFEDSTSRHSVLALDVQADLMLQVGNSLVCRIKEGSSPLSLGEAAVLAAILDLPLEMPATIVVPNEAG